MATATRLSSECVEKRVVGWADPLQGWGRCCSITAATSFALTLISSSVVDPSSSLNPSKLSLAFGYHPVFPALFPMWWAYSSHLARLELSPSSRYRREA